MSKSGLRSIVYVSAATRMMTMQDLEALLVESVRLNLEASITGVLLYSDGNFMQCFEGTEASVHQTYRRIRASSKHRSITELLNEPVETRSFRYWKMGLACPTASVMLSLSTAKWKIQSTEKDVGLPYSPGLELLKAFWKHARVRPGSPAK